MEAIKKIQASRKEIFDTLVNSMIAECKMDTGKDITFNDIKNGYKYKKRAKEGRKEVEATVHIKKPEINSRLSINVSYPNSRYLMTYQLDKIDDKHTLVRYSQIDSSKEKEGLIMRLWFSFSMKRRIAKMGKFIKKNR
ncbi:MAG: DUF3284 domain-containing protein [Erysipelotrichaceae bacterium]